MHTNRLLQPESKAVFAERDRLIGFHADRLGNGKLYRGCERLLDYLAAEHPGVQDLTDLNCPIPQIRQLYNIAVGNAPPKLKHPQFFVVS